MRFTSFLLNRIFSVADMLVGYRLKYKVSYYKYKYGSSVELHNDLTLANYSSIVMFGDRKKLKLVVSKGCDFRRYCLLTLAETGKLIIGKDNFFNNGCSITCLNNIQIGEGNLFGEGVKIYDHNHVYKEIDSPIRGQGFSKGKVEIGNNCWFGSNCVILNNVTIGDNVVIGANVLVYKSIPSNTIVKSSVINNIASRI